MKTKLTIAFLMVVVGIHAQTATVEKRLFNVQTGLLGVWANAEWRLAPTISLRTEVGLDAALFGGDMYGELFSYAMAPVVSAEPRWYFNLQKRADRGRRTSGNSGNFFALNVGYHPDWFVISELNNVDVSEQLEIVPKWGLRRHIGTSNFNYEAGFGIGARILFAEGYSPTTVETALLIHLRIGYTF